MNAIQMVLIYPRNFEFMLPKNTIWEGTVHSYNDVLVLHQHLVCSKPRPRRFDVLVMLILWQRGARVMRARFICYAYVRG